MLADALEPHADVDVVDVVPLLGRLVAGAAEGGMEKTFGAGRMHWFFDLEYLLFSRLPTRRNRVTRDTPSSSASPCMSSRLPS